MVLHICTYTSLWFSTHRKIHHHNELEHGSWNDTVKELFPYEEEEEQVWQIYRKIDGKIDGNIDWKVDGKLDGKIYGKIDEKIDRKIDKKI